MYTRGESISASIVTSLTNFGDKGLYVVGQWKANSNTPYKVEHYKRNSSNTGYDLVDTENLYGQTDTLATAQAKRYPGYSLNRFADGSLESGYIAGDGSLVLRLYYVPAEIYVHYDGNGNTSGTPPESVKITYDSAFTVAGSSTSLEKGNYSLAGWRASNGTVYKPNETIPKNIMNELSEDGTRSVILSAAWTPKTFKYTYNVSGATGGDVVKDVQLRLLPDGSPSTFAQGDLPTPEPTRVGYTFAGWYMAPIGGDEIVVGETQLFAENKTFYAHWTKTADNGNPTTSKAKFYSATDITFDLNDGKGTSFAPGAQRVSYGSKLVAPTSIPVHAGGYQFFGWYDTQDPFGGTCYIDAENKPTEAVWQGTEPTGRLYARWRIVLEDTDVKAKLYYSLGVSYSRGAATSGAAPDSQTWKSGDAFTPAGANTMQKAGYDFAGWTLPGSDTIYTSSNPIPADTMHGASNGGVDDITLTAAFTPRDDAKVTVSYYKQDAQLTGYDLAEQATVTGTTDTTATTPLLEDGKIVGFYLNEEKSDLSMTFPAGMTGAASIYYDRKAYAVAYAAPDAASGSVPADGTATYGLPFEPAANTGGLSKVGYGFAGWKVPGRDTVFAPGTQIASSVMDAASEDATKPITLTAAWSPRSDTAYTVEHYLQNLSLDGYEKQDADTEHLTGTTDATVTGTYRDYPGFTKDEAAEGTLASAAVKPDGTLVLKLYYARNTNTPYTVEHYTQNLALDGYDKQGADTEHLTGTTGATVSGASKAYTGFHRNEGAQDAVNSGAIAGDGSLVLKLYYDRNAYSVAYAAPDKTGGALPAAGSATFGLAFEPVGNTGSLVKTGYLFDGWTVEGSGTVYEPGSQIPASIMDSASDAGTKTVTLSAAWAPAADTRYTVEHYLQNLTLDGYDRVDADIEEHTATTDSIVSAAYKDYPGFTKDEGAEGTLASAAVKPDGTLVLKLYYARNTNTPYTVEHYTQNLALDGYDKQGADTEHLTGTTGATVSGASKAYTGFHRNEGAPDAVNSAAIAGDGTLILKLYYDRNAYNIAYATAAGEGITEGSLPDASESCYGAAFTTASDSSFKRQGYGFAGWKIDGVELPYAAGSAIEAAIMDAASQDGTRAVTLTAAWAPRTDTRYTVAHYRESTSLTGYEATPFKTEAFQGTTATEATAHELEKDDADRAGLIFNADAAPTISSGIIAADGSLTLKLYYERERFDVTLKSIYPADGAAMGAASAPDGTSVPDQVVRAAYGCPLPTTAADGTALAAPARAGYRFAGFWTQPRTDQSGERYLTYQDGAFTPSKDPHATDGSLIAWDGTLAPILYAEWFRLSHTYTFEAQGGQTDLAFKTVPFRTTPEGADDAFEERDLPATPVRAGYTFAGWHTEPLGGSPLITGQTTLPTRAMTYYAHWTKTAGSGDAEDAGSTTAKAKLTASTDVSFDLNGGTAPEGADYADVRIAYGSKDASLAKPAPAHAGGHTFLGWADGTDPDAAKVYADAKGDVVADWDVTDPTFTLYALWAVTVFPITVEDAGGVRAGACPECGMAYADCACDWDCCADRYEDLAASALSTDEPGGSEIKPAEGGEIAVPARRGYTLIGWADDEGELYLDGQGKTALDEAGEPVLWDKLEGGSLHCVWQADSFTLAFDDAFGDEDALDNTAGTYPSVLEAAYDGAMPALEGYAAPLRPGYTLLGFYGTYTSCTKPGEDAPDARKYYEADGTPTAEALKEIAGDAGSVELHARWQANAYEVVLASDKADAGQTSSQTITATYGEALPTEGLAAPERYGHIFLGWGLDETDTREDEGDLLIAYDAAAGTFSAPEGALWQLAEGATLHARYRQMAFTLAFTANADPDLAEGQDAITGIPGTATITYRQALTEAAPSLARDPKWKGYRFFGWHVEGGAMMEGAEGVPACEVRAKDMAAAEGREALTLEALLRASGFATAGASGSLALPADGETITLTGRWAIQRMHLSLPAKAALVVEQQGDRQVVRAPDAERYRLLNLSDGAVQVVSVASDASASAIAQLLQSGDASGVAFTVNGEHVLSAGAGITAGTSTLGSFRAEAASYDSAGDAIGTPLPLQLAMTIPDDDLFVRLPVYDADGDLVDDADADTWRDLFRLTYTVKLEEDLAAG